MRRGDIYFIANRNTVGGEIMKARPAVIVSNDTLNATSNVVEVVYLTTQPKREMFTHVELNATGRPSTALCEQIDTISKSLVGDYFGRCSEDEMDDIDHALRESLGLTVEEQEEQDEPDQTIPPPPAEPGELPGVHPAGSREGRLQEAVRTTPRQAGA